jgi:hypothetical protein
MGDAPAVQSGADPTRAMAEQMAQLLTGSDLHELREIVDRWVAEAPTERVKEQYRNFGRKLIELKTVLAGAAVQPSTEELELALAMMLKLAADAGPGAPQPPR